MIVTKKEKKLAEAAKKKDVLPYLKNEIIPQTKLELREDIVSEEYNDLANRFVEYFEMKKPYLNPDLRVEEVARELYTNQTYLARAIRLKLGKTFIQVVHWYRINEAINLYIKEEPASIQEIRLRVGFRSVSTFNNAFAIHTGKTPAEWCKYYKRVKERGFTNEPKKGNN